MRFRKPVLLGLVPVAIVATISAGALLRLQGQAVPLGTFTAIGANAWNTVFVEEGNGTVFQWNLSSHHYATSPKNHPQWASVENAMLLEPQGVAGIADPDTQSFYLTQYNNAQIVKSLNVVTVKDMCSAGVLSELGNAPANVFRAFGENGERSDANGNIIIPPQTQLILEWNFSYEHYATSSQNHPEWQSVDSAFLLPKKGIYGIANPGSQTFYLTHYQNANDVKAINVIVMGSSSACGDGRKKDSEGCDDGNKQNGDGCSATCTVEPNFSCSGDACTTSVCTSTQVSSAAQSSTAPSSAAQSSTAPVCGNGQRTGNEQCDDGNTTNGDGCASTCTQEGGWNCASGTCLPVCGDGQKKGSEQCDDGNTASGDGCASTCTQEGGWNCASGTCLPVCGDGQKKGSEQCDDGNTANGDGCSSVCQTEGGWNCSGQTCVPICGNGQRTGNEQCDDGNTASGDGCSATCQQESGWSCGNTTCLPVCGDGQKKGSEQCDDGNTANGDGCSSSCQQESGWNCTTGTCVAICGDRILRGNEQCDDGNTTNGDGCSATCVREAVVSSSSSSSKKSSSSVTVGIIVSSANPCGNGRFDAGEQCDDGNRNGNDGCSGSCATESGWACAGQPSQCIRIPSSSSRASSAAPAPSSAAPISSSSATPPTPPAVSSVMSTAVSSATSSLKPAAPQPPSPPPASSVAPSSAPQVIAQAPVSSVDTSIVLQLHMSSSSRPTSLAAQLPVCGNGRIEVGEECDFGEANAFAGSPCDSSCRWHQSSSSSVASTRTLAVNTVDPPKVSSVSSGAPRPVAQVTPVQYQPIQYAQQPQYQYVQPIQYNYPVTTASGPGALAAMAAGGAAGVGWIRRERRRKDVDQR